MVEKKIKGVCYSSKRILKSIDKSQEFLNLVHNEMHIILWIYFKFLHTFHNNYNRLHVQNEVSINAIPFIKLSL